MRKTNFKKYDEELNILCRKVKELVYKGDYETCEKMLCEAMCKYPHAPHPHNLFGIILEKKGEHPFAMNHFRAAWALDSTYAPANHNLNTYGNFYSTGKCAFDESDLVEPAPSKVTIIYDSDGIGRVVRK